MSHDAKRIPPAPFWPPAVLVAAAIVLSIFALLTALRSAATLPAGQLAIVGARGGIQRVDAERLDASASARLREARLACEVARQFVALERNRLTAENEQQLAAATTQIRGSAVGRLEMLALRLRRLDRSGREPAAIWADVQPLLQGLEAADFRHDLTLVLNEFARRYTSVGLRPGTAAFLADERRGYSYGPFVQILAARLWSLADERRRAGDEAGARLVQTVAERWLRQWTVEPAPIGLRLLAAETLASCLTAPTTLPGDTPARDVSLAASLRGWRERQRSEYFQQPADVLMPISGGRAMGGPAHERAVDALVVLNWTVAGLIVAAFLSILSVWFVFGDGPLGRAPGRNLLLSGGVALGLVLAGVAWAYLASAALRVELRGDFSGLRYIWWHVVIAGGLTAIAIVATSWRGPRSERRARLAARSLGVTLGLAVCLIVAGYRLGVAGRAYEREQAAAIEQGYAIPAPPESSH
jgi:hypothetical protein